MDVDDKAVMELLDKDVNDIAQQLQVVLKDKEELREYEGLLREVLAQKALDQPSKILVTDYGTYKAQYRPAYKKWDRDALAHEVYRLAQSGKTHVDPSGEVHGESDWRIYDAFKKAFRLEPRVGEIKKLGLDADEYSTSDGDGRWDVQVIKGG